MRARPSVFKGTLVLRWGMGRRADVKLRPLADHLVPDGADPFGPDRHEPEHESSDGANSTAGSRARKKLRTPDLPASLRSHPVEEERHAIRPPLGVARA